MSRTVPALATTAALLLTTPALAVVVPGTANPNLAGRATGYACCSGDMVPEQAPPSVTEVEFESCDILTFEVTGRVSFTSSVPMGNNPDGDDVFDMTNYGDGISAPTKVRTNALLGVFLTDESPTLMGTPSRINVGDTIGAVSFEPDIGQIFFIGDGLTSDSKTGQSNGGVQSFVVPRDATRLFLGTADGEGWFNNAGSFTVDPSVESNPSQGECGDAADPEGITATDALVVLRAAVGTAQCADCICDVDRSHLTTATDSLAVLKFAVGQAIDLRCGCCQPPA